MARGATERAEPAAKVGEHELAYLGPAGQGTRTPWSVALCSCPWSSALHSNESDARRAWEEHAREAVAAS